MTLDMDEKKYKVKNGYLKPGDYIKVHTKEGIAYHFGIYIGDGQVIHFATPEGQQRTVKNVIIGVVSINYFAGKFGLKGVSIVRVKHPLDPAETIRRAKSLVGKGKGTYNLKYNNCETVAYWCKTGNVGSQQVNEITNKVSDAASKVAKVALGANKTVQKYASKSSVDKVSKAVHDAIQNKIHGTTNRVHENLEYFK